MIEEGLGLGLKKESSPKRLGMLIYLFMYYMYNTDSSHEWREVSFSCCTEMDDLGTEFSKNAIYFPSDQDSSW